MLAGLSEQNASVVGFKRGQQPNYLGLLNGLLLASGADAANILADDIVGISSAFVKEMNDYANRFSLKNTHFKNVTGLD